MTDPVVTRLILIRHARTQYDKSCVPPENPPLDPEASHDYASMRSALPDNYRWLISPLKRCQDTAKHLIKNGAKLASRQNDDRLREQSYGLWHGKNIGMLWESELAQLDKHNWHFLHPNHVPPDGESFAQVMTRLAPVITEVADQNTVLVTHGMVIRALVGLALGMPPDQSLSIDIAPLSITALSYMKSGTSETPANGGQWQLNFLNCAY